MLLIQNGHIKPMVREELENGCILVYAEKGKIYGTSLKWSCPLNFIQLALL